MSIFQTSVSIMSENSNNFPTLNFSSDLHLSNIDFPKFTNCSTTTEEVNEFLRKELQHIKLENEKLEQQLTKKDAIIQKNQTKIQELVEKNRNFEGFEYMTASQVATSKIADLSKKLRERNSEIEVYKSKCLKLEKNLSELQKQCQNSEENDKNESPMIHKQPDEITKLQEKLNYITNKWTEEKNHNLKLKNDLKKANKWLQQEVGDKFETLLALNNSNSNWRGRAQIICDLQQKNQELKEKLKAHDSKSTPSNESITTKYDNKVETLNKENLELKSSYDDLKKKFDMAKARCRVLETECAAVKLKVSSLNKKIDNNNETIEKLTSEMSFYHEQKNEYLKQKEEIKLLQQENEALKIDLIKEKCLSENKSKELMEKNDDIQLLNKRIRNSRPSSAYVRKHDNPETKTIGRLEVERLRLLELTQIQNNRLQDERNAHLKTQHLLRAEKQKAAKLEANVARLQLEQNSARSAYSNKLATSKQNHEFDLGDKLELAEENIKALTARLEREILERKNDLQQFSKILNDD